MSLLEVLSEQKAMVRASQAGSHYINQVQESSVKTPADITHSVPQNPSLEMDFFLELIHIISVVQPRINDMS